MNILQIGLGKWGKNHSRIWGELKNEKLIDEVYFYDLNSTLMKKTANMYNGVHIENLNDLEKYDLVDIVVPANLHYEIAKPFIESGLKVFIEKPFTDNLGDAQNLIDISNEPEKQIMVGHIFRFHSGVNLAKNLISRGAIGDMQKLDIRRLAFRNPRTDNGVIFSLAIHDLDLFCYFNDEKNPSTINTITSTIHGPTEDHAFIKLEFEKNIAVAEESWMSAATGKIRTLNIKGTDGELRLNFSDPSKVNIYAKYLNLNDQIVDDGFFTHTVEFKEPLKEELVDFVIKSKNNKNYLVGPRIGKRAVELCQLALRSAKENKIITYL